MQTLLLIFLAFEIPDLAGVSRLGFEILVIVLWFSFSIVLLFFDLRRLL